MNARNVLGLGWCWVSEEDGSILGPVSAEQLRPVVGGPRTRNDKIADLYRALAQLERQQHVPENYWRARRVRQRLDELVEKQ